MRALPAPPEAAAPAAPETAAPCAAAEAAAPGEASAAEAAAPKAPAPGEPPAPGRTGGEGAAEGRAWPWPPGRRRRPVPRRQPEQITMLQILTRLFLSYLVKSADFCLLNIATLKLNINGKKTLAGYNFCSCLPPRRDRVLQSEIFCVLHLPRFCRTIHSS